MNETSQSNIQGQHYERLSESLFNFQGPARDIRGYSSAGRAPALQAGGQRFDPAYLHQRLEVEPKSREIWAYSSAG